MRTEREAHFRKGLAVWEQLRPDFPRFKSLDAGEAHALHRLGNFLFTIGRHEQAESHLRRSITIYDNAIEKTLGAPQLRGNCSHAENYLGRLLLEKGRAEEAEKHYQLAAELLEPLVSDFPDEWRYTQLLCRAYGERVQTLIAMGRFEEAEQAHFRALEFAHPFAETHPSVRGNVAWQHYEVGLMYHYLQDDQQAAESFREAFTDLERLLTELDPDMADYGMVGTCLCLSLVTCPLSQFRDAKRSIKYPKDALQLYPLGGGFWNILGIGHYRAGNWDDSIEALNKSVDLRDGGDSSDFFLPGNGSLAARRLGQSPRMVPARHPVRSRFRGSPRFRCREFPPRGRIGVGHFREAIRPQELL